VRGRLADALLLLIPGGVTAIGLFAMSASLVPGLERGVAAEFLLFLPWQMLGLTVAKFGADSWILANGSKWTGGSLPLQSFLFSRIAPAATIIGLLMLIRLPAFAAAVGALSILFDAVALVLSSELSAQGRVRRAAASHFLRYPLLFTMVTLAGWGGRLDECFLYGAFVVSSASRLGYLLIARSDVMASGVRTPNTGALAAQQVLNYGLFKNDQLAFSLIPVEMHAVRQMLIYVVRFPELVSALIVAVGPVVYPALRREDKRVHGKSRSWLVWPLTLVACCFGGYVFGAIAPSDIHVPWYAVLAVAVHASLVLPVNLNTYKCFSEQKERELLTSLLIANAGGVLFLASILLLMADYSAMFLWVVPLQQVIFLRAIKRSHRDTCIRSMP